MVRPLTCYQGGREDGLNSWQPESWADQMADVHRPYGNSADNRRNNQRARKSDVERSQFDLKRSPLRNEKDHQIGRRSYDEREGRREEKAANEVNRDWRRPESSRSSSHEGTSPPIHSVKDILGEDPPSLHVDQPQSNGHPKTPSLPLTSLVRQEFLSWWNCHNAILHLEDVRCFDAFSVSLTWNPEGFSDYCGLCQVGLHKDGQSNSPGLLGSGEVPVDAAPQLKRVDSTSLIDFSADTEPAAATKPVSDPFAPTSVIDPFAPAGASKSILDPFSVGVQGGSVQPSSTGWATFDVPDNGPKQWDRSTLWGDSNSGAAGNTWATFQGPEAHSAAAPAQAPPIPQVPTHPDWSVLNMSYNLIPTDSAFSISCSLHSAKTSDLVFSCLTILLPAKFVCHAISTTTAHTKCATIANELSGTIQYSTF